MTRLRSLVTHRWFVVLALVHLALLLYLLRDVGLAEDEWTWLLYLMGRYTHYSSWQTLVAPYNHQPIIGELLIYRGWAAAFGPGAHWLIDLFFIGVEVLTGWAVYWMVWRRPGVWPALMAAALVLFEGRAWESLLFPASMTFVLPAAAVCLMWCALDLRRIPLPTWVLTAAALAFSAVSGGLGIAVAGGGLIEASAQRSWRRALMIVPCAVTLLWWYVWEFSSAGVNTAANLRAAPWWVVRFIISAAGACFGLPPAGGVVVLVLGVAVIVWLRHGSSDLPRFWTPRLAGLIGTLLLAAATTAAGRAASTPAGESRYMYFPAIVLLLIAAETLRGVHLPNVRTTSGRVLVAAGAVITVGACVVGINSLRVKKVIYQVSANATAARTGAMLAAGGPALEIEPGGLAYGPALLRAYVHHYGMTGIDTPAQIAAADPGSRGDADAILAAAQLHPIATPAGCRQVSGDTLAAGVRRVVISGPATVVLLRRFAPAGGGVPFTAHHGVVALRVAASSLAAPWRIGAPGDRVHVC